MINHLTFYQKYEARGDPAVVSGDLFKQKRESEKEQFITFRILNTSIKDAQKFQVRAESMEYYDLQI